MVGHNCHKKKWRQAGRLSFSVKLSHICQWASRSQMSINIFVLKLTKIFLAAENSHSCYPKSLAELAFLSNLIELGQ